MSMNKLVDSVEKLVNQEYELSSKDHGEQFSSFHEAYAVIKEEIEEAQKELGNLYKHFSNFWDGVKHDAIPSEEIEYIARSAHLAACELIQVTAMAYKATLGLKGDNNEPID